MTRHDSVRFPLSPSEDDSDSSAERRASPLEIDPASGEDTSASPNEVLAALADSDSRAILAASTEQQRTVAELVEQCDIPTATAYRKVNTLVDAGLLDEHVCIRPYGRNVCKYSLRVERIHAELTESGVPTVSVSLVARDSGQPETYALPDGGHSGASTDNNRRRQLQSLFLDVTGQEELVDEQEPDLHSRHVGQSSEEDVSRYVANIIREDGLSDTLPEPDEDGRE